MCHVSMCQASCQSSTDHSYSLTCRFSVAHPCLTVQHLQFNSLAIQLRSAKWHAEMRAESRRAFRPYLAAAPQFHFRRDTEYVLRKTRLPRFRCLHSFASCLSSLVNGQIPSITSSMEPLPICWKSLRTFINWRNAWPVCISIGTVYVYC